MKVKSRIMQFIPNWQNKNLKCSKCGTTKSVKYSHKNKNFCNACIAEAIDN